MAEHVPDDGEALAAFTTGPKNQRLTTNQGVPIEDDQNSLRAEDRGPTLLEDFILREKLTHFDHERIPERVVHARGSAAHGFFQVYEPLAQLTRAKFLNDPSIKTPVFVRFSTVGGSRGSADTPRDVRGFAVKFYTEDGNYDLVGNNMPVFFIQDAVKFPDFVHAVKPEPHNEMPQAASAHDTFWDFVSLTPEATHMVMWLMSDRALPRSYRSMEGFGVHTFRFVNDAGESRFVKFHWKPLAGVRSLAWDEAQKISGKDPDFNRRDLWESIEAGDFPEWELGVQVFGDEEADAFPFDILDSTKLVPEELVPVQRIGKMTLDRNPDNFFAETEQVAFCTSHVVPGIDFTNDPLLQGRLFSYLDTQLSRLGGPNFHQLPINRPRCPFANNQRDGMHQMEIVRGTTSYNPNSIGNNFPSETPKERGGFATYPERIDGHKRRIRSESFKDFFSQATLFWKSQSHSERDHLVSAFVFELSKVTDPAIREREVGVLSNVDETLAARVASGIGSTAPQRNGAARRTDGVGPERSEALSMERRIDNIKGQRVAILTADGADGEGIVAIREFLLKEGAHPKVVAPHIGQLTVERGSVIDADMQLAGAPSVLFDAVFVTGGTEAAKTLAASADALHYVQEAFRHCKPVAAIGEGRRLLEAADILKVANGVQDGVITGVDGDTQTVGRAFVEALKQPRYWSRQQRDAIPA